jgi:hypothetical protein
VEGGDLCGVVAMFSEHALGVGPQFRRRRFDARAVVGNLNAASGTSDFRARRPEVSMDTIEKYFHSLWRAQPDLLYSVPREFIKNCRTPILVQPRELAIPPGVEPGSRDSDSLMLSIALRDRTPMQESNLPEVA